MTFITRNGNSKLNVTYVKNYTQNEVKWTTELRVTNVISYLELWIFPSLVITYTQHPLNDHYCLTIEWLGYMENNTQVKRTATT